MKITDTQLVEKETIEGWANFICDSGRNKEYNYKFIVECTNPKYGITYFTVSIYFNYDMSSELYCAIDECFGDSFFSDIKDDDSMSHMSHILCMSMKKCDKLVEYINKYSNTWTAKNIRKIHYNKGKIKK